MPAPLSAWLRRLPQAGLIFLVTGGIVSLLFGRTHWVDWTAPHWLEGDPLEIYARVKIAAEQPGDMLTNLVAVEALGAPVAADWTGYPTPDLVTFFLTGLLARGVGLIAATHLMSAVILALNAASFYLCARWLRWRWEWAAAFAVIFALCTYNVRWGISLSFSQTFTLPPLILLCARSVRPGSPLSRAWTFLAIGLGLWLGQGNPYLAYFSGIVAGGALLLGFFRRSHPARTAPLGIFISVLVLCFLTINASHIRLVLFGTDSESLARSIDDIRIYSLRPLEWLIPPADHRASLLGAIGHAYYAARHGSGEFFYNYLGIVGVVGIGGLIANQAARIKQRRWRLCDSPVGLLWIIAFGVIGGLNYWLAVAGMDFFRASTRIGIFAQIWALLFLGGFLSRQLRIPLRPLSVGLAGLLVAFAVWDQTPPLADATGRKHNLGRWQSLMEVTTRLERDLPPNAKIFQLPVVPFPEAGRTGAMPDYEHLLPYLTSTTLHYSYGHLRTAPALRWARYVSRLSPVDMAGALEQAGFSAIWIDPRAYADGAAALIEALSASGRDELTFPNSTSPARIFLLTPSSRTSLPDFSDLRFRDPWDDIALTPHLLALQGWDPLESDESNRWRWARREAAIGIWTDKNTPATLRFRLGGPDRSTVILLQDGREIWRAAPGFQTRAVTVNLSAGLNTLHWRFEGKTFRPGGNDPRELGFMVENLSVSVP